MKKLLFLVTMVLSVFTISAKWIYSAPQCQTHCERRGYSNSSWNDTNGSGGGECYCS